MLCGFFLFTFIIIISKFIIFINPNKFKIFIFILISTNNNNTVFVLCHDRMQTDCRHKLSARSSLTRFVSNFVRIKTFWQAKRPSSNNTIKKLQAMHPKAPQCYVTRTFPTLLNLILSSKLKRGSKKQPEIRVACKAEFYRMYFIL